MLTIEISGAARTGKTTLARVIVAALEEKGIRVEVETGDERRPFRKFTNEGWAESLRGANIRIRTRLESRR